MTLRLLYFLSVISLWAGVASAQVYQPGLLVRANGDTLRGEIENDFWREPPLFIRYRRTAASPSELLLPRQLRTVSFVGGRLFRYEALPIDHAATTKLDELPLRGFTDVQVDTLLAEILIEGPATLRRVVGTRVTHYLLSRPGQPLLDLSERQYQHRTTDGQRLMMDGNNYKGQLSQYFQDCPAAFGATQAAAFTPAGLAAVVQAYNTSCTPGQQPGRSYLALARPRRVRVLQGGVLAGARYNRIESPSNRLAGTCTDCGVHAFGGLYGELLQPNRLTALYGELTLSGFRNQGIYTLNSGPTQPVYNTFSYQAVLGTARIGVRYFVPLAHDQLLLLTLGFEYNRVFGFAADDPGWSYATPSTPATAYANTVLLPNIGVGWRYQRFTVNLDGQMYTGSSSSGLAGFFVGSNVALRLGVGCRLGRHPDARPPGK